VAFGIAPGTVIAGYEIERSLGRGGMGDVYLARKEGTTRRIALKLLHMDLAADTRFRNRFERESYMATELEHPNIVPVYETGEVENVRYIAMRFVDGPTLRDVVDQDSPLDPRRVLAVLDQVASALDAAHEIGLVHRDVKPANVLVARGGASEFREHAYLTDFGVSKFASSVSEVTRTGQFVGTSMYAAPEQIKGEKVDGRTDVYSFGILLFECLTGRPPFERETEVALMWAQMTDDPPPVTSIRPELPEALNDVVGTAMAKEPNERFQTCLEVVTAARAALGSRGAAAVTEPAQGASPGPAAGTVIVERPPVVSEPVTPAAATVIVEREPEPVVEPEPEPTTEQVPEAEPELVPVAAESVLAPPPPVVAPVEVETPARETIVRPAETVVVPREPVPAPETWVPDREPEPRPDGRDRGPGATRKPVWLAAGAAAVVLVLGGALALILTRGDDTQATGTTTTTTTGPTGPAPVTPPTNDSRPAVSGTPRAGETLLAAPGTWSHSEGADFAYLWQRCEASGAGCASIGGATLRRYTATSRDVGRRLRVAVTVRSQDGTGKATSPRTAAIAAALKPPRLATAPAISGYAQEGSTLQASAGKWEGTAPITVKRVWLRCNASGADCDPIGGESGTDYRLGSRDIGHTVRVRETATSKAGRKVALSKPSGRVQARPVPTPTVTPSNPKPRTDTIPVPPPF